MDERSPIRSIVLPLPRLLSEYIVWRVLNQSIAWFRLEAGEYVEVQPDERGVIESTTFPGLRLNVPNMLAGDLAGVLAELD